MSDTATVDDVIVDLGPAGDGHSAQVQDLLDAAGDNRVAEVRIDTSGLYPRFIAPRDVVDAAGLTDSIATDDEPDLDDSTGDTDDVAEPPRNGKRDAWVEFLDAQGVAHDPEADRGDLIAAWDAHRGNTTP